MRLRSFILLATIAAPLLADPSAAQAPAPETAASTPAAAPEDAAPATPFSLSQVDARAARTSEEVGQLEATLVPDIEVGKVRAGLAPFEAELEPVHALGDAQLDAMAAIERSELYRQWTLHLEATEQWQETVGARAETLQRGRESLRRVLTEWEEASAAANEAAEADPTSVPEAIRDRIDTAIESILQARTRLRERHDAVLTLQSELSELASDLDSFRTRLEATESRVRGKLLALDEPPLWATASGEGVAAALAESFRIHRETLRDYFADHPGRFLRQLATFVGLLIFTLIVRRRARVERDLSTGTVSETVAHVERRPYSAAGLMALLSTVWIHPDPPRVLTQVSLVLGLFPLARILSGLGGPRIRTALGGLLTLIMLDLTGEIFFNEGPGSRGFLMLIGFATLSLLVWAQRASRTAAPERLRGWWRVVRMLLPVAIVAVTVGLFANLVGAALLGHLLIRGTADAITMAAFTSALALILRGAVAFLLRRRSAFVFRSVQVHQARIERLVVFGIDLWLFGLWFRGTARMLGLYLPLKRAFEEGVNATWAVGDAEVSIAKIGIFLLALTATWATSRVVRVLLKEDVFSRVELPRGVPATISMLTGYSILAGGALFSVSAAGMDIGKLSFIAGGLGVGIGFGLQNVVQNFVSGLILAFERPVQVGDVVEVGPLMGKVTEIGVRSSHMRTFDGAEVIIPNGGLISKELINWTLSDQKKRLAIPVTVELGADPHQVLDLLRGVAADQPDVLEEPAPLALFQGFAADGLSFRLLAWVETSKALGAGSALALAAHDALKEAGLDVPTLRQQVRVVSPED